MYGERTSRIVRLARAACLVAAVLAHGKAADLNLLCVAAGALADWGTLGRGHGNAGVDLAELLVNLARPLVVAPVCVPAACPTSSADRVCAAVGKLYERATGVLTSNIAWFCRLSTRTVLPSCRPRRRRTHTGLPRGGVGGRGGAGRPA